MAVVEEATKRGVPVDWYALPLINWHSDDRCNSCSGTCMEVIAVGIVRRHNDKGACNCRGTVREAQ